MLGTYGDVTFETSAERMRSWTGFQRSGKARWAAHELVQEKPVLQYVGPDLEDVKFGMRFDVSHGLNPLAEIDKLRKIRVTAEPQALTIGGAAFGKFVLESIEESHNFCDAQGRLLVATVNLSLKEYHERGTEPQYRQGLSGVSSLATDAGDLPWQVADEANGIADVPDEALDQVTAVAGDAGGGFLGKLANVGTAIQQGAQQLQNGVSTAMSQTVGKMGLSLPGLSSLAGTSPAGAVSQILEKASGLPIGQARQALSSTLGSNLSTLGEKYLGRSGEFSDTARFAKLDWLPGTDATRALGDLSVNRAASLASKLTTAPSKAADLARIVL